MKKPQAEMHWTLYRGAGKHPTLIGGWEGGEKAAMKLAKEVISEITGLECLIILKDPVRPGVQTAYLRKGSHVIESWWQLRCKGG